MANTTKRDLIREVAGKTGMSQVDARIVVEQFLDTVAHTLQQGKHIELRGFGRFKLRTQKPRTARNPRTGETVEIKEGIKPVFEASVLLRNRVNEALQANGHS
jgi:DNA-binding protein HU-beta/integration host factor subunit beta